MNEDRMARIGALLGVQQGARAPEEPAGLRILGDAHQCVVINGPVNGLTVVLGGKDAVAPTARPKG